MWGLICTAFLLLFSFSSSDIMALRSSAAADAPKNILILHMENSRLPGNTLASKTIDQTIPLHIPHRIFEEFLDENRLSTDPNGISESLQRKYRGQKIDLLMAFGPAATRFLVQHGSHMWPTTPKVFFGIDARNIPSKLPAEITGVAGSYDFVSTIDLARKLQPGLRHIFYVGGASPEEQGGRRKLAERDFQSFAGNLDIIYLNSLSWPELLYRVAHLPANSAVLFTTYFMDANGQAFLSPEACKAIAKVSSAPVYGMIDTVLDCGIVGGSIFSIEASARSAATMGIQLLSGRSVSIMAPVNGPANKLIVDARQLKKWKIPQANVPPSATVINRKPSVWQRYKKYSSLILVVIIPQILVTLYLFAEVRRRQNSDKEVLTLTGRLISASEEERCHIARELHDDLGQRLSLVSVQIGALNSRLKNDEVEEHYNLSEPLQELADVITDVHELSHRLHSSTLDHLGLEAAIRSLCQKIKERHDLKIELKLERISFELNKEVSLCFYRITQEALSNIIKHSGAKTARVTLSLKGFLLSMEISDAGLGFNSKDIDPGLGLTTMAERVKLINGRFHLDSTPGNGTIITATVDWREQLSDSNLLPRLPSMMGIERTGTEG